jgi:hypothetical protein
LLARFGVTRESAQSIILIEEGQISLRSDEIEAVMS